MRFIILLVLMGSLWGREDLNDLLKVMEVPHEGTTESIVEATQKYWLRPAGKERWQIEDDMTDEQKQAVYVYCIKNHFFEEIKPKLQSYDYALLMGAAIPRMQMRLNYLAKLVHEGVQFKQVILLSGARPLDSSVEIAPPGCKTEGEAMAYLWKNHPLSHEIRWTHLDHPMISEMRRPSVSDSLRLWLTTSPRPGKCLIIYNQPYCLYAQAVAENTLPQELPFETVGPSLIPASVLLDNLARCLYEDNK